MCGDGELRLMRLGGFGTIVEESKTLGYEECEWTDDRSISIKGSRSS